MLDKATPHVPRGATFDISRLKPDSIGVIADDFTGALDAGVQFARAGLEIALVLSPRESPPVQVHVLSTDSRDGNVATARRRVAQAAERLQGRLLYKKIDSTMRGHVGPEIEALLRAAGVEKAVVCPAVIEQGRQVRDGKLWVGEALLHQSDFAHDPSWPATTSDMAGLLGVLATHLDLETVRAGADTLTRAVLDAPTRVVTVDACEGADLARIAAAIVAGRCLPCGALGLARAWVNKLVGAQRGKREPAVERGAAPILVVAGSRHPRTRAQVHRAALERGLSVIEVAVGAEGEHGRRWQAAARTLSEGRSVILRPPLEEIVQPSQRLALDAALAECALRACREFELGGLVLTGGQTANAVCCALEAVAVHILGELEVGIPWGKLMGGAVPGLQVVTKAGGFGHPDSLIRIVDAFCDSHGRC